jgi:peroxiredoxin (alkyl hydroperoxide reductase subunit C)
VTHEVCLAYGVRGPLAGALRATFVIDREGVVQYQIINSLAAGRDIDELLRVIDALRQAESDDTVRPRGSRKTQVGMTPAERGVDRYLAEHSDML